MAARQYRFFQVDVFTDRVFGGNPLAVFPEAEGLSDAEMAAIAREMNLSETTFVLPPTRADAHVRVRIFTPTRELPFAGHPTVGTTYMLATLGRLPSGSREAVLEEGVGPVPVRLEGHDLARPDFVWMRHPAATFEEPFPNRAPFAEALGLSQTDLHPTAPVQAGSTGVRFVYVPLRDRAAVDRATLDPYTLHRLVPDLETDHIYVLSVDDRGPNQLYTRMFAPLLGIAEDPATGSAAGPLGVYAVKHGLVDRAPEVRLVAEQGTRMGRQSFLHIGLRYAPDSGDAPERIEVGGSTVPVVEGTLRLP